MEFKKIKIDTALFYAIAKKVEAAYRDYCAYGDGDGMKEALKEYIFIVEKEKYIENAWNSCDVYPPEEYEGKDVLLRKKKIKTSKGETNRIIVCYYEYTEDGELKFVDDKGANILDRINPSDYEYKIIND